MGLFNAFKKFFDDVGQVLDDSLGIVQIGVGDHIAIEERHGVVFVRHGDSLRTVSFIADKPYRLTEPTTDDIRGLFEQLVQMELVPVSLELMLPSCRITTYRVRDLHPEIADYYGIDY